MNLIPMLELYQEDELIYSWMFCLAKLNDGCLFRSYVWV